MADVVVGARLELDAGDSLKSMKDFKKDIKDAQTELLNMQERFGATSKEAIEAAKKVAGLKDQLKEANEVAELFDPGNKFKAIGNAVNALTGGFTALTGAMGLLGVESEEVQKQLLKVQSALALSQGLSQVADSAKDFGRLKDILVNTFGKSGAIGIAIAGVTALGAALLGVFNKKQAEDVKAYNETLKDYQRAAAGAIQQVTSVKIAFENARAGLISKDQALKVYNDTLGNSLGRTNDLSKAEALLTKNADNYIKVTALKAQANALFAKAADQAAQALIDQENILKSGIQNEGGVFGAVADKALAKIERTKNAAKEIENLGANLLRQAAGIEQSAGINTATNTTGIKVTTKGSAAKLEEVQQSDALSRWLEEENLKRFLKENELRDINIEAAAQFDATRLGQVRSFEDLKTQTEQAAVDERIRLAEAERDAKILAAQQIGNALGALAQLIGQQTAAGKVLALAQIGIDTAVAISGAVRQASKNPLNLTGFAFVADMAARIGAIIANIAKAKQLLSKADVSTGSITAASYNAPLQATLPQSRQTRLDQDQLNQIGNAASRAFVVESDITNSQERIRRLNRAARI